MYIHHTFWMMKHLETAMTDNMTLVNDFIKARRKARMQRVFSTFRWKNPNLLSFYEVTKLLKPESQSYKGMMTIPVKNIIGSENRYNDFSSAFAPKNINLQKRWENIDRARLEDVILPPISVYKLGDWYFVRDGNHRVSVARMNGQEFIDAEVVELSSHIKLEEGMTLNEIKKRVVEWERQQFIRQYNPTYLPMERIVFTTPGSYPEMVNHILVHKYYANEHLDHTLTFEEGAVSWYNNVYKPIVDALDKKHLLSLFPGYTESDIYMWLVRRWDEMKRQNAYISQEAAAEDVKKSSEGHFLKRWIDYYKRKLSRK